MLRIGNARNGAACSNPEQFRRKPAAYRAESAQALFGRHRDQPHGGAETREKVSRGMAWSRCARWHRAAGNRGSRQIMVAAHAADLARAAQQRDDNRRAVAISRLAAEIG